jgi:hypothetical protein
MDKVNRERGRNISLRITAGILFLVMSLAPLYPEDPMGSPTATIQPTKSSIFLQIYREYRSDGCVSGYLAVENQVIAYTLERPDVANLNDFSAIGAGTYPAHLRYDKPDKWRIQLDRIPRRTNVQIHIGTQVTDSLGCILVGDRLGNDLCTLVDSSAAYNRLKKAFYRPLGKTNMKKVDIQVEIEDPPPPGHVEEALLRLEIFDPSDREKVIGEALRIFNAKNVSIEDAFLRGSAAVVLGKFSPTRETSERLLNRLGIETDPIVRGKIIESLGEMGPVDPEILPLLIQYAGHGKNYERGFALQGLGCMGPEAQPALKVVKKNLGDEELFIWQSARWALNQIEAGPKPRPLTNETAQ